MSIFWEPEALPVHDSERPPGQVWLLPSVGYDGRRRVAVMDFNGTLQQVTYYGGRAFHHEGSVPSEARDHIVEACQLAREEWLTSGDPPRPTVTQFYDPGDMVHTVLVDARPGTPLRILLNEVPVHDTPVPTDPTGPSLPTVGE